METPSGFGLGGLGRAVGRRLPVVLLPVGVVLGALLLLGLAGRRQGYVATATLRLQPAGSSALVPGPPARPPTVEGLAATLSTFLATQGFALLLQERTGEPLWPAAAADAPVAPGGAGGTATARWQSGSPGAAVRIEGRLVPRTAFYRVSVQHPDPGRAVALANAIAELLATPPGEDPAAAGAAAAEVAGDEPARLREELALIEARTAVLRRQLQALAALDGAAAAGASTAPLVQELRALEESRRRALAARAAAPSPPDGAGGGIATVVDRATQARPAALARAGRLAPAAGLAALLAGLALALGLHARDGRAHDAAEVAAALGLPAVGRVPALLPPAAAWSPAPRRVATPAPAAAGGPGPGEGAAGAPVPETYRRLALRLAGALPAGADPDGGPGGPDGGAPAGPCLLFLDVTSTHAGAAAPMVAAHLAAALAQEGRRVLLVDGCLARPALLSLPGPAARPGLAERLAAAAGTAGAAGALQEDGAGAAGPGAAPAAEPGGPPAPPDEPAGAARSGAVVVVPAGAAPAALAAGRRALGAGAAPAALAALGAGGDLVLIAGPAVLETVDAVLLARAATATYLCVRLEETGLADAVEARELLVEAGGRPAGVVVVEAPPWLPWPRPGPPGSGALQAGRRTPPAWPRAGPRPAAPPAGGAADPPPAATSAGATTAGAGGLHRGADRAAGPPAAPAAAAPAAADPGAGGPGVGVAGQAPAAAFSTGRRGRRGSPGWQQAVEAIDTGARRLATPPPDRT